jgi:hypothetical protein
VRDCSAVPASPTLTITAATLYLNGTVSLSCTDVGNGATTYAWTLPNGLTGSSNTNTITVTGATAGTYAANTISVKATNACGNTTATGSGGAIVVRSYKEPVCSDTDYMVGPGGTFYYCGITRADECQPVNNRPGLGTYTNYGNGLRGNVWTYTGQQVATDTYDAAVAASPASYIFTYKTTIQLLESEKVYCGLRR